jgi:hypothetical protein
LKGMLGGDSDAQLAVQWFVRGCCGESRIGLPREGQERDVRDLGREQSPWKDRLSIKLATTWRQYGLIGGVKP